MKDEDFTYGLWEDSDQDNILYLMRLEYGGRSLAHGDFFDWQYRQNPAGRAAIICCRTSDGSIVAICPVLPVRMRLMGKPIMGSLAMNILTHPDYRGRGLFTKCAKALCSALSESDIHFTYGFPNNQIHRIWVDNVGFADIGTAELLIRPHDLAGLLSTKLPFMDGALMRKWGKSILSFTGKRPNKTVAVSSISRFERLNLAKIWEETKLVIDADAPWLQWRYLKAPHRCNFVALAGSESDPVGLAVFGIDQRSGAKIGILLELMIAPDADAGIVQSLMAHTFDECERAGCVATLALTSPGSRKAALLKAAGFWKAPNVVAPHPYNVIYYKHSSAAPDLDVDHMDISFGMSDM